MSTVFSKQLLKGRLPLYNVPCIMHGLSRKDLMRWLWFWFCSRMRDCGVVSTEQLDIFCAEPFQLQSGPWRKTVISASFFFSFVCFRETWKSELCLGWHSGQCIGTPLLRKWWIMQRQWSPYLRCHYFTFTHSVKTFMKVILLYHHS